MPYKNKERQKKSQHESYLRNKDKYIARKQKTRRDNKKYVLNIRKNSVCCICGFNNWMALVFHHRNKDEKIDAISNIADRCGRKKLDKELIKCDIICANCHAIIHMKEWYKNY